MQVVPQSSVLPRKLHPHADDERRDGPSNIHVSDRKHPIFRSRSLPAVEADVWRKSLMRLIREKKHTLSEREKWDPRGSIMSERNSGKRKISQEENFEVIMERFQLRKFQRRTSSGVGSRVAPVHEKQIMELTKVIMKRKASNPHVSRIPWKNPYDRLRWRLFWQNVTMPLLPDSLPNQILQLALFAVFMAQLVYTPFQFAFAPNVGATTVGFYVACEVLYLLDFVMNFNTAFYEDNKLITSRKRIASRYLKGWLVVDLIASIPVNVVLLATYKSPRDSGTLHSLMQGWSRLLRMEHYLHVFAVFWMMRTAHVGKEFWKWISYSRYSHLLRIAKMVFLVVLTTHYVACFWEFLSGESRSRSEVHNRSLSQAMEMYTRNFYIAIQLIQGQGIDSSDLNTVAQDVFSSVAILVGSLVLAIVFGNVAMLVSNFNANTTNYQRKLEAVFATVSKLNLPNDLRDRIHTYYDHLWHEYESLDGDIVKFSKDLTHTLALEVGLFRYMNLITDLDFWKECSADFVTQIILHLVVRIYLPDDYVMRQGEVGDQLFMINRGVCELIEVKPNPWEDSSPSTPIHTNRSVGAGKFSECDSSDFTGRLKFCPGQAFGELALIMNYKRTRNVRAVTHLEMCVLYRRDFQFLLSRYRDDRIPVLTSVLHHCMKGEPELPSPFKDVVNEIKEEIETIDAANAMVNPERDSSGTSALGNSMTRTLEQEEELNEKIVDRLAELIASGGDDESIRFGIHVHRRHRVRPSVKSSLRHPSWYRVGGVLYDLPKGYSATEEQIPENRPSMNMSSQSHTLPIQKLNGRAAAALIPAYSSETNALSERLMGTEQIQTETNAILASLGQTVMELRSEMKNMSKLLKSPGSNERNRPQPLIKVIPANSIGREDSVGRPPRPMLKVIGRNLSSKVSPASSADARLVNLFKRANSTSNLNNSFHRRRRRQSLADQFYNHKSVRNALER